MPFTNSYRKPFSTVRTVIVRAREILARLSQAIYECACMLVRNIRTTNEQRTLSDYFFHEIPVQTIFYEPFRRVVFLHGLLECKRRVECKKSIL